MKQAVIITENKYPCEDAGAIRQHATAKILQSLGYDIFVIGYGTPTGKQVSIYENVRYISLRSRSSNKAVKLFSRLLFGIRALRFVRRNCRDASLILVVDTLPYAFKLISHYADKLNALLVHDSVEWYSPEEFRKGEKDISYRLKELTNQKLIGKGWRVIAISSFLEAHFSRICDKTVRIPVIMDVSSIEFDLGLDRPSQKIKFVYAGAPGRKDYLKEIIEGFALLTKDQLQKLELHIVGANAQQLRDICGVSSQSISMLGEAMIAHGRVPHEEAVRFVRDADYTLLFRDASLRYAKAGFPTKIVESLSCGTPPVCNLSSDLGMYLKNGENSIISEGHDPEHIKLALEDAMAMSSAERQNMRKKARETAETYFDYHRYVSEMEKLVK